MTGTESGTWAPDMEVGPLGSGAGMPVAGTEVGTLVVDTPAGTTGASPGIPAAQVAASLEVLVAEPSART